MPVTKLVRDGVQRGAAELAASFMDASAAAGEDPSEKRRRDAAGIPQAATGDEIRARSADLVPDAATSHAADQVLFGFTRLGSKIAAASVAALCAMAAAVFMRSPAVR